MCKCDFCHDSKPNPRTGQMECPFRTCLMSREKLNEIIKALGGMRK